MTKKVIPLTSIQDCDYDSYSLVMTVEELINTCTSSAISRTRNIQKEEEIIDSLEKCAKQKRTPFFQTIILHCRGAVTQRGDEFILESLSQFNSMRNIDDKKVDMLYKYEVIDGNSRLYALNKLMSKYCETISRLIKLLSEEEDSNQRGSMESELYDVRNKYKILKDLKINIQIYTNLTIEQKLRLFTSVNQGEQISKARLITYVSDKAEHKVLTSYIEHTNSKKDFPYTINLDKDSSKTPKDRLKYIPAIYLLAPIKQLIKYCQTVNMSEEKYNEFIFDVLDTYILEAQNPIMLRKPLFSIFATVIKKSFRKKIEFKTIIDKMNKYNYSKYGDIGRNIPRVRDEVVNSIFHE